MTWQIMHTEPAYGICDQCKKHTCGIMLDGSQQWVLTGLEDKVGDRQVIGYKCVEMWAQNMGISKEVVTKEVVRDPSDTEIGEYVNNKLIEVIKAHYKAMNDELVNNDDNTSNRVNQPAPAVGSGARRAPGQRAQAKA